MRQKQNYGEIMIPPPTADRDILDMLCSFKYDSIAETWCSRLYDANIGKIQTAAHTLHRNSQLLDV